MYIKDCFVKINFSAIALKIGTDKKIISLSLCWNKTEQADPIFSVVSEKERKKEKRKREREMEERKKKREVKNIVSTRVDCLWCT